MTGQVEVTVGVVGRAHGVRGEVAVLPRTDEPERRFAAGAQLRAETGNRRFVVSASRWHSGRLLVAFAGVTDRTAAEALRSTVLVTDVPVDERPDDEAEYYDRQLVGLTVRTADGVPAGTLRSVLHVPGQDLLEIDTADGVALVPFVHALVPEVDLDAGTVTLADVPGLLGDAEDDPEDDPADDAGENPAGDPDPRDAGQDPDDRG